MLILRPLHQLYTDETLKRKLKKLPKSTLVQQVILHAGNTVQSNVLDTLTVKSIKSILVDELGLTSHVVNYRINELVKGGYLIRPYNGVYIINPTFAWYGSTKSYHAFMKDLKTNLKGVTNKSSKALTLLNKLTHFQNGNFTNNDANVGTEPVTEKERQRQERLREAELSKRYLPKDYR